MAARDAGIARWFAAVERTFAGRAIAFPRG
jgi:hypothetical protein